MSNEKPKAPEAPVSFKHLSGLKVGAGHAAPEKPKAPEAPISFEHIGGVCVRPSSDHPSNVKPDAPAESEEDDNA
jgi:hypothetical protein